MRSTRAEGRSCKGALLVVGPGARGRGGIASVIHLHSMTGAWRAHGGHHLATFDDRTAAHKAWSALRAYLVAPWMIVRARIVHVHLAAQTSLTRKLPIAWLARLLRRPLIVHVHAPSEEALFRRTARWKVALLFRAASRVVALSESWAVLIRKHVPGARVVVIPNPVLARAPRERPSGMEPMVLFVGKLDARKGYADLLAAAAIVLKHVPFTQFWFAGHGEVLQARALCEQLGIAGSVRFAGWVQGAELEAMYLQATLLALPSYAEGVPMSVIEAMSHGVPVVCTPVGGLPEWIVDEQNGLFVEPGDVPALAAQMLRLLSSPAFAARLGGAGWRTVLDRCELDIVSGQLDALYTDVLSGGG